VSVTLTSNIIGYSSLVNLFFTQFDLRMEIRLPNFIVNILPEINAR
jgi:hypothetical protein